MMMFCVVKIINFKIKIPNIKVFYTDGYFVCHIKSQIQYKQRRKGTKEAKYRTKRTEKNIAMKTSREWQGTKARIKERDKKIEDRLASETYGTQPKIKPRELFKILEAPGLTRER